MRLNLKTRIGGLFCSAMAVFLVSVATAGAGEPAKLPAFTLKDLEGKEWSSAQLAGKPVMIDFWATWCEACKQSVPKLAELQDKYKSKGLVVIGVSVDKASPEKVGKWAKKQGINYKVLLDPDDSMSKLLGFEAVPSLYVFNRKGALQKAMAGYDPEQEDQLTAAVEASLK